MLKIGRQCARGGIGEMRDSDIMRTYCRNCGGPMITTDEKCSYCHTPRHL